MSAKKLGSLLSLVMVLATASFAWASPSDDEKQIRNNYQIIADGYAKRDAKRAMEAHIKDDSLIVFDVVKPFEDPGYQRNLEKTQNFMDATMGPIIIDYQDIHVTLDKHVAFTTYKVHIAATGKQGQKIDLVCRGTQALKKIGGKWLIVVEHNSMPQDWKMEL